MTLNTLITLLQTKQNFYIKSQGKSMLPIILPDDLVYYKKIPYKKCQVNDLVMIRKGKVIITHRIISKSKNYLITKGDNSPTSDGKIYPTQIIGKVYQVKRNGKIFNPENFYLIQSSLYFEEIVKIKRAFDKEHINFVFLKGLPLHLYFEKSHPRRIYADCDILVQRNSATSIDKLFINNNYKKVDTSLTNTLKSLKNKTTEVSYYRKLNNFPIVFDIHFEISILINQLGKLEQLYPERLIRNLSGYFLQSKNRISVKNETFSILSNENLILYLALHFFHHNFQGEYRLEFLAKIISKNIKTNWEEIGTTILTYKLQNFVYPVFLLLRKYYKTSIPQIFLRQIIPASGKLNYINKNILKINIFNDEPRIRSGVTRFKNLLFLSPQPWWKRLLIIFNLQVIYSIIWVMVKKFTRK